ncbi:MAG TPA: plasmid replication initiator TrfA [Plasticicumulans sp.]|nr:plasmid replication initiator TrfA [Plasticicumulans sp.]HNK32628.1 plasmid replication initiator TrfA [Plasticicumulans sp.]
MNDPIGKARELAARQRQKTAASATVSDKPAGEQLPLWSEALRGVPNELVRSSLFSARDKREPRRSFRGEDLVVLGDGRINYRGEELRQDDETVWLHVLHLARLHPLGESVEFTPHAFLKAIGWGTSAKEYTRLREHLSRMQATALSVYSRRLGKGCSVSLIRKFEFADEAGQKLVRWRVYIEPEMHILFGGVYYTQLEWEQRMRLGTLACWLHGLYSSHTQPFPMKVETLKDGCGSAARDLKNFRYRLRRSLEELRQVGFLSHWYIDRTDLVHVQRTAVPTDEALPGAATDSDPDTAAEAPIPPDADPDTPAGNSKPE